MYGYEILQSSTQCSNSSVKSSQGLGQMQLLKSLNCGENVNVIREIRGLNSCDFAVIKKIARCLQTKSCAFIQRGNSATYTIADIPKCPIRLLPKKIGSSHTLLENAKLVQCEKCLSYNNSSLENVINRSTKVNPILDAKKLHFDNNTSRVDLLYLEYEN